MPALVDGYDIVGHLLMEAGPLRSGLQYLEYALALDPGLHRAHLDIARAYALRGAWDQAEQQIARAGTASPRSTALWVTRARLTLWQRDRAAAAELLTRPNLPPAEYPLARRLLEVITSGQPAPVEEMFGSGTPWQHASPRSRVWRLQLTAEVQAFCGAHAEALRTIEQAIDAKLIDLMWLERCPLLAPLRKSARWPALRHTMEGRAAGVHRALGWPTTTAQAAAARG
jgi:serine/threonine-protein kinase